MEIIVDEKGNRDKELDYGYADISDISSYQDEDEVLLNPLNTY